MCLRATGPLRAMKCPSSKPVSTGAHAALQRDLGEDVVAQVAQHSAGVGQLGAAQVVHAEGQAGGAAGLSAELLAQLRSFRMSLFQRSDCWWSRCRWRWQSWS